MKSLESIYNETAKQTTDQVIATISLEAINTNETLKQIKIDRAEARFNLFYSLLTTAIKIKSKDAPATKDEPKNKQL